MNQTVDTIVDLYKAVHHQLREVVEGLNEDELDWAPGPDTNTVAVLVTHTLGSELDTLLFLRDLPEDRDRDAEFEVTGKRAADLLAAIDRADELLDEHGGALTEDQLSATLARPGREPQSGLHWLISNYGHAREHLGHVQLTLQLYGQRT